jgi:hypothetical protein
MDDTCNPSYMRGISRRITVRGQPGQKHKILSEKQIKTKRAGDMA